MKPRGIRHTAALTAVLGTVAVAAPGMDANRAGAAPTQPVHGKIVMSAILNLAVAPHSRSVWTVGDQSAASGSGGSYVLRRSGSHWKRIRVKGDGQNPTLYSVAAGSPKAAWVSGSVYVSDFVLDPFLAHSSGGTFKPVKLPNTVSGSLQSVSASSASNAWATGGGGDPVLIEWNGHSWQSVEDSAQAGYGGQSVVTTAPNDTWILANKAHGAGVKYSIGHWNGHTVSPTGTLVGHGIALSGIAADGPNNAWVVGWRRHGRRLIPYTAHWAGHSWKRVKAPAPSYDTQLSAVSMAGAKVYATGGGLVKNPIDSTDTAYMMRFVHGRWQTVSIPKRSNQEQLQAIAVTAKTSVAAGYFTATKNNEQHTLGLQLKGKRWKPLPVPK